VVLRFLPPTSAFQERQHSSPVRRSCTYRRGGQESTFLLAILCRVPAISWRCRVHSPSSCPRGITLVCVLAKRTSSETNNSLRPRNTCPREPVEFHVPNHLEEPRSAGPWIVDPRHRILDVAWIASVFFMNGVDHGSIGLRHNDQMSLSFVDRLPPPIDRRKKPSRLRTRFRQADKPGS